MLFYFQFLSGPHSSLSERVRVSTSKQFSVCLLIQPFWLLTSSNGRNHLLAVMSHGIWFQLAEGESVCYFHCLQFSAINFTLLDNIYLHNCFSRTRQALNKVLFPSAREHWLYTWTISYESDLIHQHYALYYFLYSSIIPSPTCFGT
jgi:hypothetical protein